MAEIANWYDKIGVNNNKKKLPSKSKNQNYHKSMMLCIGGTGQEKLINELILFQEVQANFIK